MVEDNDRLINEIETKIKAQPWRFFRIGTWELGDSLALENETGQAQKLIDYFSTVNNAVLELKTKSDVVDPIFELSTQSKNGGILVNEYRLYIFVQKNIKQRL